MAAVDTSICGSCFAPTKYTCFTCRCFCMRRSVFEEAVRTRSLQNNNVKRPNSAFCGQPEPRRIIFGFYILN